MQISVMFQLSSIQRGCFDSKVLLPESFLNIFILNLFDCLYQSRNRAYGHRDHRSDHVAPSIRKKLAVTSPTSGGPLVGIVRLRT
jgi:hypothetical protein